MKTEYEHCARCGRVISDGDTYCELCRKDAETAPPDPDRIHDPEVDPLPHRESPEPDQKLPSLDLPKAQDV